MGNCLASRAAATPGEGAWAHSAVDGGKAGSYLLDAQANHVRPGSCDADLLAVVALKGCMGDTADWKMRELAGRPLPVLGRGSPAEPALDLVPGSMQFNRASPMPSHGKAVQEQSDITLPRDLGVKEQVVASVILRGGPFLQNQAELAAEEKRERERQQGQQEGGLQARQHAAIQELLQGVGAPPQLRAQQQEPHKQQLQARQQVQIQQILQHWQPAVPLGFTAETADSLASRGALDAGSAGGTEPAVVHASMAAECAPAAAALSSAAQALCSSVACRAPMEAFGPGAISTASPAGNGAVASSAAASVAMAAHAGGCGGAVALASEAAGSSRSSLDAGLQPATAQEGRVRRRKRSKRTTLRKFRPWRLETICEDAVEEEEEECDAGEYEYECADAGAGESEACAEAEDARAVAEEHNARGCDDDEEEGEEEEEAAEALHESMLSHACEPCLERSQVQA